MNKVLIGVLLSAWVGVSLIAVSYFFSTPREMILTALSQKEGVLSASVAEAIPVSVAASSTSLTPPASASIALPTITLPTIAPAALSSTNATSSSAPATDGTTYEYKLLEQVDLCTLNKLGKDGWHATQFGGTLIPQVYGKDATCTKAAFYDVVDWILFERVLHPQDPQS